MQSTSQVSAPARQQAAGWRRWPRRIYLITALMSAAGVVAQVFLAGAGVLVDPAYFGGHRALAHAIELLLLVLLLTGLVTGLPWRVQRIGALLLGLMVLQYVFLYAMPAAGLPILRALHAVNALAMFGAALGLVRRIRHTAQSEG